ncbi:lipoprotein NlpD [Lampropedia hyalina DSM 16112]|jgi:lipoprotein NlpD|uniref:Lipoprotein NlpD n=1 Tax=Lampropedia hyalina DSM 16112 TaxID=1122156 RepID=A0A1M5DBR1_9BURK|nr:peptidoglycan DD-metalloendopeptidase family protein [Lampropedia hyalina]SHF64386.1 lipoprotein NlpD [Lampropedia hyalina DSM 16112]
MQIWRNIGGALAAGAVLAGCSSVSLNRAPVENISGDIPLSCGTTCPPCPASACAPVSKPPVESAASSQSLQYYTVQPGDTLSKIARKHDQSVRKISEWNNISNPNVISVGQRLAVSAPVAGTVVSTSSASASGNTVVVQPVSTTPSTSPAASTNVTATALAPLPPATASAPAAVAAPATPPATSTTAAAAVSSQGFIWPASGQLINGFNETTNKGYGIAGNAGDPVLAAQSGQVVYAGSGLRGYGNLLIIKHNDEYLTAYAHNRALLVKEGDQVSRGQRIAEMGNTDTDRVKLHFEVRRQGKPVNPGEYLPKR